MIDWIPEEFTRTDEFLPEELEPIRDYVLEERGVDISIPLHVYEERALLKTFKEKENKIYNDDDDLVAILDEIVTDDRELSWSVIGSFEFEYKGSNGDFFLKTFDSDIANVKKCYLLGWLEYQLWNRGDKKKQLIYKLPKNPEEVSLTKDSKGYFFDKEFISFSIESTKLFLNKYFKQGSKKKTLSCIDKKSSLFPTEKNWYVFVTHNLLISYLDENPIIKANLIKKNGIELGGIRFSKKKESDHAAIANYDTWQYFLHNFYCEEKNMMNDSKKSGLLDLGISDYLNDEPIKSEVKSILKKLSLKTNLSELSDKELSFLKNEAKKSPRVRLAFRLAQLQQINKFKKDFYKSYLSNKQMPSIILNKLLDLKSKLIDQLHYEVYSLDAVRGVSEETDVYNVNDKIVFSIDIPRKGTLTIFHFDEEGNINLIFPSNTEDNIEVESGGNKRIGIKVSKPIGKQIVKAILMFKKIPKPKEKDYKDNTAISKLVEAASELEAQDWMEAIYEYRVIDE